MPVRRAIVVPAREVEVDDYLPGLGSVTRIVRQPDGFIILAYYENLNGDEDSEPAGWLSEDERVLVDRAV